MTHSGTEVWNPTREDRQPSHAARECRDHRTGSDNGWRMLSSSLVLAIYACGGLLLAQQPLPQHGSFFMGRVKYSRNDGKDCGGVGQNMARLVSQISTVPISEERKIALTEEALFETPFLFMNGHNDFVLGETELENLRIYLEHGGFLFTSGCCTNPAFPKAWRREMARLFPGEQPRVLPYDHPIYRAFYRIDRVRSLHRNTDVHLEGLFYQGRLVAVICEDGLCCAFSANNACNVGRGIAPEDGKQLALNLTVYAMTH